MDFIHWEMDAYRIIFASFNIAKLLSITKSFFYYIHTCALPSISVLFTMTSVDAKELFCSRDAGNLGLIWGGKSAFMLFIMISSKAAPSSHRKINIPIS